MTTDQPDNRDVIERPDPQMGAAYLRVILVEIIVLLALWAFGSAFSG
jgi:hypothetical protein